MEGDPTTEATQRHLDESMGLRRADAYGDHFTACSVRGPVLPRGFTREQAWVQVVRAAVETEGSAVPGQAADDRRRLDFVVYGAVAVGEASCCDTTLMSLLCATVAPSWVQQLDSVPCSKQHAVDCTRDTPSFSRDSFRLARRFHCASRPRGAVAVQAWLRRYWARWPLRCIARSAVLFSARGSCQRSRPLTQVCRWQMSLRLRKRKGPVELTALEITGTCFSLLK